MKEYIALALIVGTVVIVLSTALGSLVNSLYANLTNAVAMIPVIREEPHAR